MRQGGLCQQRDRFGELRQRVHLSLGFHERDCRRGDCHRADGFFMTFVTNINNAIALACARAHFVMHLGDERTHRVDHVATAFAGGVDHGRCRTMCRQHDRTTLWHFADVVNEDHATFGEAIDDDLVVHDLVIAVHRSIKRSYHPRECLDCHLDAGAKTTRRGEQHSINRHLKTTVPFGRR